MIRRDRARSRASRALQKETSGVEGTAAAGFLFRVDDALEKGEMMATKPKLVGKEKLTHDDVVSLVGDLDDAKIATILATGATARDLEEAIAWAEAESDAMGEMEKRLDEPAASVYRVLMTRKETEPDR
jgi:hypothetical protein